MSHFYATIPFSARKTVPTACGNKSTGIATVAASHKGAIRVYLWHDKETDLDYFEVHQVPWQDAGISKKIAFGIVGE